VIGAFIYSLPVTAADLAVLHVRLVVAAPRIHGDRVLFAAVRTRHHRLRVGRSVAELEVFRIVVFHTGEM